MMGGEPKHFIGEPPCLSNASRFFLLQVRLNTMRSLGTFIGPFSSTILCVLPKERESIEMNVMVGDAFLKICTTIKHQRITSKMIMACFIMFTGRMKTVKDTCSKHWFFTFVVFWSFREI